MEGLLGAEPTPDPLAYVPDQILGVDEVLSTVTSALAASWPGAFTTEQN